MAVDPVGGIRVALNLKILAELFVADRTALGKQNLDLLQDEGVALDRSRVMRLFEPDSAPDTLGFQRRQAVTPRRFAQLTDLQAEPLVHRRSRAPTASRLRFVRLRH